MDPNYYLVFIESQEMDAGRLEAGEILRAFFDAKVWLFGEMTPQIEALSTGDQFFVCGHFTEGSSVLGHFSLKSEPKEHGGALPGLRSGLEKQFLLSAEIEDMLIWENPRQLAELVPQLAIFTETEAGPFSYGQGLRQISERDFRRIMQWVEGLDGAGQNSQALADELSKPEHQHHRTVLKSLLETEQWLDQLARHKIPERLSTLQEAAAQQRQIPLLKDELAGLINMLETERKITADLRQKNEALKQQLGKVSQELETAHERFNLERQQLLENITSLQTRQAELQRDLEEIGTVKKALQRIIFLLRGEKRKSG